MPAKERRVALANCYNQPRKEKKIAAQCRPLPVHTACSFAGAFGLRWRTEREVFDGRGQFTCGNKACTAADGLQSFELLFAYDEHGERKQALVKVRACPKCADKLSYRRRRDEKKARRREDKDVRRRQRREERRKAKEERRGRKHRSRSRSRSRERDRDASERRHDIQIIHEGHNYPTQPILFQKRKPCFA